MHVDSFVELLLNNRDKLDKMAELLDELHLKFKGEDVVPPLSHNNNVTIGPLPPTSQYVFWTTLGCIIIF